MRCDALLGARERTASCTYSTYSLNYLGCLRHARCTMQYSDAREAGIALRLLNSSPSPCLHTSPSLSPSPSPSPRAHARARRYESTSDNSESESKSESLSKSALKRRGLTEQLHPSSYYTVDVPTVDEPRAGHCVVRTFLRDRERITADSGWQTADGGRRMADGECPGDKGPGDEVRGARCEVRGARCEEQAMSVRLQSVGCQMTAGESVDININVARCQTPDPRCERRVFRVGSANETRNRVRLSASECMWGSDEARSRALSTGH